MSTVTTFLNLVKAASIEAYNIATLNNNLDLIDNWVKDKGEKQAKGLIGNNETDTASTGIVGTEVTADSVSVNLVSGNWYQVTYRVNTVSAGSANIAYYLKCKRGSDPANTAGVEVDDAFTFYTAPVANQGKTDIAVFVFKAATTETINIKITTARVAGSSGYDISLRKLDVFNMGAQVA